MAKIGCQKLVRPGRHIVELQVDLGKHHLDKAHKRNLDFGHRRVALDLHSTQAIPILVSLELPISIQAPQPN